jgi:hypothetical protein
MTIYVSHESDKDGYTAWVENDGVRVFGSHGPSLIEALGQLNYDLWAHADPGIEPRIEIVMVV